MSAEVIKVAKTGKHFLFFCPGCMSGHMVNDTWSYNQDPVRPTFQPSVLVSYNGKNAGIDGAPPAVCHSFITDGQIQFLGDSTHKLANQTVPLQAWPENYGVGDD